MGREIKRVKENFNYPIGKIWYGYLNPYCGTKCPVCDGDGYSEEGKKYRDRWYDGNGHFESRPNGGFWYPSAHSYNLEQYEVDALWEEGRLRDVFGNKPTADEVNKWAKSSRFGHDSINEWICLKADAKKNGYDYLCPYCNGEGKIRDEEAFQNWKPFDPEEGEYYQLWETTSEGSPKTPPFKTPEELAKYCVDNKVSIFANDTLSYDEWLNFITDNKALLHKICNGCVTVI